MFVLKGMSVQTERLILIGLWHNQNPHQDVLEGNIAKEEQETWWLCNLIKQLHKHVNMVIFALQHPNQPKELENVLQAFIVKTE